MKRVYFSWTLVLVLAGTLLTGCGGGKKDIILQSNPYEKLAFYGQVLDQATQQAPLYPIKIFIEPDDPGNHVVVDSHLFFIEDKGLDPIYDYTLKIRTQYYSEVEMPLKYQPGKTQNLGIIQIAYIEPKRVGPFKIKPFTGFTPGAGILESPGWSITSFINYWEANYGDTPFKIGDVEHYVKDSLPEGSPTVSKQEMQQAIDGWLKDGLISAYGRNSYKLK